MTADAGEQRPLVQLSNAGSVGLFVRRAPIGVIYLGYSFILQEAHRAVLSSLVGDDVDVASVPAGFVREALPKIGCESGDLLLFKQGALVRRWEQPVPSFTDLLRTLIDPQCPDARLGQLHELRSMVQQLASGQTVDFSASSDPYAILGVSADADAKEIKAAYHRELRLYHPDLVGRAGRKLIDLAEAQTKRLISAYALLMGSQG